MPRERLFMYLLPTCWAFLFLERPLLAMRALLAMPFRMLVDALPGEFFLAVWASSASLEPGLRGTLSTVFALMWIMVVVRMTSFHLLFAAECARQVNR